MKSRDVPQQVAKAFEGGRKALYAVNEKGEYEVVPSAGWEAEEIVLDQAIAEFDRLAADAWNRAKAGTGSTLEFHMYKRRMDDLVLAQATGRFRWLVRYDLRRARRGALGADRLAAYAAALGITVDELRALPEQP